MPDQRSLWEEVKTPGTPSAICRPFPFYFVISVTLASFAGACDERNEKPDPGTGAPTVIVPSRINSVTVVPTATAQSAHPEPAPAPTTAKELQSDRLAEGLRQRPVEEQREYLLMRLDEEFQLGPEVTSRVRTIIEASNWLSFGNPKVSRPSMTRDECRERRSKATAHPGDAVCPFPNMAALYDPKTQTPDDATVCIDQFEFPNIACEYPIVWVRSAEAAGLCEAMGKRLCWAHEWEGACAGSLLPSSDEYPYAALPKYYDEPSQLRPRRLQLEHLHNVSREVRWAYGEAKDHGKCATTGNKSATCSTVDWSTCGTNDFPAGAFPECVSPFGVYDQHGNAAEHMSLPVYPQELDGKSSAAWTEMKGSWFIFSREEAHPDDCRWRAKNWHTSRVDDPRSHRNYHLGFRCCADRE